ncbi:zinc-finger domain-containing protein [Thiolinea disciformis]|uniref:zinc-finger domain-containing protein n=1 Tax=Thiolinea disciformis TaxID=125614 RepID=UPI000379A856
MMATTSTKDYERLGTSREVIVTRKDLPLHCPTDTTALWCSHPRVFLPIDSNDGASYRCPYCGTLYRVLG